VLWAFIRLVSNYQKVFYWVSAFAAGLILPFGSWLFWWAVGVGPVRFFGVVVFVLISRGGEVCHAGAEKGLFY